MGVRERLSTYWPVLGLELATPRLRLRPLLDEDLPDLIDERNNGVHEPDLMPFEIPWSVGDPAETVPESLRHWWTSRAAVTADDWALHFGIHLDDRVIGVQSVMAKKFAVTRSVDTGSWIGLRHQGSGVGTEMRAAVLLFAFDTLGALSANSEAFVDNPRSLGVSAKLGYRDNGTRWISRLGERTESQNLLVVPATFVRPDWSLRVRGFEACKAQLGLQ